MITWTIMISALEQWHTESILKPSPISLFYLYFSEYFAEFKFGFILRSRF